MRESDPPIAVQGKTVTSYSLEGELLPHQESIEGPVKVERFNGNLRFRPYPPPQSNWMQLATRQPHDQMGFSFKPLPTEANEEASNPSRMHNPTSGHRL